MPPVTPSSTWRPASDPCSFGFITALPGDRGRCCAQRLFDALLQALGALERHLALRDLLEGDRERLVPEAGRLDERRHELAPALAELRVVRVDLARSLGGGRHEAELGVHGLHQVVDLRLAHANRFLSLPAGPRVHGVVRGGQAVCPSRSITPVTPAAARSASSFPTRWSNRSPAAISSSTRARRRSRSSPCSVPLASSRRMSSSRDG